MSEDLRALNRRFYDALWADARLVAPERFNTWPAVQALLPAAPRRLEVAPGLRPRLPIAGGHVLDISAPALAVLRGAGALASLGDISALPYPDASFDLACACDVVEHVDDDAGALAELARVIAPGGLLLLSVPLHMASWSPFDELVGHRRRYDPAALLATLAAHGFVVERSASHGMRPRNSRLVGLGMWFLQHQRDRAMWWYNKVFMPLGVRLEKPLTLRDGVVEMETSAGVLLVCRKDRRRHKRLSLAGDDG